jgi:hypothetical protein
MGANAALRVRRQSDGCWHNDRASEIVRLSLKAGEILTTEILRGLVEIDLEDRQRVAVNHFECDSHTRRDIPCQPIRRVWYIAINQHFRQGIGVYPAGHVVGLAFHHIAVKDAVNETTVGAFSEGVRHGKGLANEKPPHLGLSAALMNFKRFLDFL